MTANLDKETKDDQQFVKKGQNVLATIQKSRVNMYSTPYGKLA